MRRGEIRVVDVNPFVGSESDKRRPAVVVSNHGANATAERLGRGIVTVVPVTSNVSRVFPFQVLLPAAVVGLRADSKAQAEQIRSIDVRRIGERVGRLTPELLAELDRGDPTPPRPVITAERASRP
jgi:mRNA interferase MazF